MKNICLSVFNFNQFPNVKLKFLAVLFLISFSQQNAYAYVWDGQFDATYNQCDGSFTFQVFLFQDCPGCDDYVNANFALQFKDNTGNWQKLVLVKAREIIDDPNGWGNKFSGPFTSFNNNNVQQWRLADGNIGNFTVSNNNVNPFVQNNWINVLNENDTNAFAFAFSTLATTGYYHPTISGQNQEFNNIWWANSGGAYQEPKFQVSTVTLGLATYIVLKWINPPQYLRDQTTAQFRMPFATTTNHNFSHKNNVTQFNTFQTPSCTKTVSIDAIKTPSGLIATKNANCNNILINWSVIKDYCKSAHYRLYRDDVLLDGLVYIRPNNTTADTFVSSYIDNNPIKGIVHKYQLELVHFIGNCGPTQGQTTAGCWDNYTGQRSSAAFGKVKSAPPAPYGLTATDNKCNKTIELAWSVNQSIVDATPLTAFRLERATNATFTAGLTTFDNIIEGARSFVDTSVQENARYFYRLRAMNGCSNNANDMSNPSNTAQGTAPGIPPKVTGVNATLLPFNKIQVTWTNSSPFIDNFVVTRSLLTGGGTTNLSTLSNTITSFTDSLAQICVDYVYRIKSTNTCNTGGVESDDFDTIRINPNLSTTFHTPSGKVLKASKGYYPNRVELNWTNNNGVSVTGWKIYRKNMSTSSSDSVLIASPSPSSGQYIDYTTDANIFYKYTIIGEANCGTAVLTTNTSEDIGFRYPSGTVSGSISYEGGIAVKDVKVVAQTSAGSSGYAMSFDGSTNSGAQILASPKLNDASPFTIEFWMRPTSLSVNATLIKKSDYAGNTQYAIEYNQATNTMDFWYQNASGTIQKVSSSFGLSTNQYVHVTAVREANKLKLYKNGLVLDSLTTSVAIPTPNVAVDLGYNSNNNSNKFAGNLDELRIYKRAKTAAEIARDFNRYINPEDNDLVAYFPMDENVTVIRNAYDLSKSNGQFNENRINFNTGVSYSSTIPNSSELNNTAYTDTNGFYVINACRYTGTGQNFTMTPSFGTHSFTPSNKIEFIGEGSNIKSNVNFTDNSSFIFNGKVTYKNTICPVEGAIVYIDNAAVIKAGEITKSDVDGKFQVRVPIGEHYIEVKYPYHAFSVGRFPAISGTLHNFQSNVFGEYQFVDSTLRKVVGRIVGGQVEAKKALNLGRSKNNIGKARIIFHTLMGSGCKKDTVWTQDTSGEYVANLLPVKYEVGNILIPSNPTLDFANSEGIGKQIDVSIAFEPKKIIDSVFRMVDSAGRQIKQYVRTDSTSFHTDYSYTIRNAPTILMKGQYETNAATKDSFFIGEPFLTMGSNDSIKLLPFIPGNSAVNYPVFKQYTDYEARFELTEDYLNYDGSLTSPIKSRYPVTGILNITNTVGTNSGSFNVPENGKFNWKFTTGLPNMVSNNVVPKYSYTNPIQVTFSSPGANIVEYLPFPMETNGDKVYRAYVFGKRNLGSNFVTRDVDKVDFILRDPPGSNSFASWTRGTKKSTTEFKGKEESYGGSAGVTTGTGAATEVYAGGGFGAIVMTQITEVETQVAVEAKASYNYTNVTSESYTEENENLETISTSSSPDEVGHMADVFIGYGKNTIFGGAVQISLVDTSQCNLDAFECIGNPIGKYQLAKSSTLTVGTGVAKTRFTYTTREIEEIVIPNLMALRNNLFVSDSTIYKLNFKDKNDKVKYGSNNDDKNAWSASQVSSTNARKDDFSDSTGQSYTFYPSKNGSRCDSVKAIKKVQTGVVLGLPQYGDSVYWVKVPSKDKVREYNKQILQWKIELAKNEREKHFALGPNGPTQNVDNLSVGTAIIQKTMNTTSEKIFSEESEHFIGAEIGGKLTTEVTVAGVALDLEATLSATTEQKFKSGKEESNSRSTTFDYIFQDEDQGDLLNLAVKNPQDGGGHIFKVLAGQTSCPYQAAEYLKWYDPTANDNSDNFTYIYPSSESGNSIEFSPRTMQRDVPEIQVAQPKKINIPADEAATFNLVLGNLSETNHTRDYTLKVELNSNPFGAIVKVDGLDPNRTFTIPAGVGINKTLTIEKGPIKFQYDSIMLIFHAACDVDKENLADTVYVSAYFVPACNKATLQNPGDLWTSNNITGDTIPILIKDYNYNLEGFSNIQLKYKKTNTSIWSTQEVFHKDTTGMNNPQAKLIPTSQSYITYQWPIKDLADGPYEVRLDVKCDFQNFPNIIREMPKQIGIIDKINPVPFGTPSPGDGILDPNDDISIQFNEPLDNGTMGFHNFDIRGVLNETPIRNATSLYFNGTNNYMEVPGDVNLQQRDYSFETWIKRGSVGTKQTILSQGADGNQSLEIGFDTDNKLYYKVANGTTPEVIKSDNAYTDISMWHHLAFTYNHATEKVLMFWDGAYVNGSSVNSMFTDNLATGKIQIARNLSGSNQYFNGNLHEMRIWSKYRTEAEIISTMNKMVNRSNPETLFNWRLDEAEGTEAKDAIRERNATIFGATWQVDPSSSSVALNGSNQYVKVGSGNYGISREMDMTLEFWFNSNQSSSATLFSNGKGINHTDSITAWSIQKDASGKIHVRNNNYDWIATDSNYFDGQWHHFALVLNRKANTTVYVDGNQQKAVSSQVFNQFGGGNAYLGALGYFNGSLFQSENYFQGNIDEFRFWNTARLVEQVKRDKRHRLKGDELGLLSYVPFELYVETNGIVSLTPSFKDIADTSHAVIAENGASLSAITPTLKLPRAVQSIQFTYVLNNDKIVLTPNVASKFIENVTLDITTRGVKDKNGNIQQSPKTWIAYIDKNQVVWSHDQFSVDKKLNDPHTLSASVVNKGGATKSFTIDNVPSWMTVTPTSGVIAPNSILPVTINIDQSLAIGDYENDLQLLTDFGFAEKLTIKVKCRSLAPSWTVNPNNFQYSMNIIGKLKINSVVSSDIEDKIALFVGDECRGVANVRYVPAYDDYFVFLDLYSNVATGGEIYKTKAWDASVGAILTDVTPQINFASNDVLGSLSSPIIFNASNQFAQIIPIYQGWNWISANVLSTDSNHLPLLLKTLNSSEGDVLKSQSSHSIFRNGLNWQGSLNKVIPDHAYMLKSDKMDTLVLDGILANPTMRPIRLLEGWNWIGFNSIRNLPLNQALGGLNPLNNDLIKGKNNFAIYDNNVGWIGSLSNLKPGEGYLYKSGGTNSFSYPIAGYYKSGEDDLFKNTYFNVEHASFESNMNMIANIDCIQNVQGTQYTLAVFDNKGRCRGAIKLRNLVNNSSPVAFLTIAGSTNESLNFKLYDEKSKSIYNLIGSSDYVSNQLLGSLQEPVKLKMSKEGCETLSISANVSGVILDVNVYPNTIKDNVMIEFDAKLNGIVNFELYDMVGNAIGNDSRKLTDKKLSLNSLFNNLNDLSSGIYLLNVTINNATKTFKLVK
jgi:hypothetical protein